MIAQRLDGRREADRILKQLTAAVRRARRPITLATILVGNRFDSALYVKLKRQAAARVGINTEYIHLPETTSQARLEKIITELNRRKTIHGILLQLPLPKHLDADAAIAVMDPKKDADGFHQRNTYIVPPPVAAVLRLIALGKPKPNSLATIIAKPSVFTTRLAHELEQLHYSAIILPPHRLMRTITAKSDVLVTALGEGSFVLPTDVKSGAIIVDVGIRKHDLKTVGDVTPSVWKKASAISPVPGGVGPMTIAFLLWNTYQLARRKTA